MSSPALITLRTRALLRLDPKDSSDRWHALFLEAGLLTTLLDPPTPGSPLTLLREARASLLGLQDAEAALRAARAPVGGLGNHVPLPAWFAALAVPVLAAQLTRCGQDPEEELLLFAYGIAAAGALAAAGLAGVGWLELRARRERAATIAVLEARTETLLATLAPAARAVLSRSFVARVGPRLVVSTPHLAWLQACAATARRGASTRPEHSAELEALVAAIEVQTARVQTALQALQMEPPQRWSDAGLAPGLEHLRRQVAGLGLTPDPLCAALDEVWGHEPGSLDGRA